MEEVAHASGVALVHGTGLRSGDPRITPRFRKTDMDGFRSRKLFEELFEQIVKQCVWTWDLVQGKHLSVDGSFVEAECGEGEPPRSAPAVSRKRRKE